VRTKKQRNRIRRRRWLLASTTAQRHNARLQETIARDNRDQMLKQQKSVKSLTFGLCQKCGAAWGQRRFSKLFGKAVYCDGCWEAWRPIAEAGLAYEVARLCSNEVLRASK
jgi:RNA polymerase-binding transcription factor DksA